MTSVADKSIEYPSKALKGALKEIAEGYCEGCGSPRTFVFIERVGFADVVPAGGKVVRRGLQSEIADARELLMDLVGYLTRIVAEGREDSVYNSIRLRQLLKTSQTAYHNISHRMMRDLLSVSPKGFTMLASLYNDVANLHKLINAVRYGETDAADADHAVRKMARRIVTKASKAIGVFDAFENHAATKADDGMFTEHNIMAYRYRNSFYINVELLLEYLGLDPTDNKSALAREVRSRSAAVCSLLDTVERSDTGKELELVSR